MKQGKITYIGWVGHNNIGDEALYQSNQKIFEPYQLIPDEKRQHSKITLFGGGTLHSNWLSSIVPNRYNYAYGVGVRNPSFWGPDSSIIKLLKKFNFRYFGVRGITIKKILEDWGIHSEVIGDPCLLLEPKQYKKRENTKIGINMGSDGLIWGQDEEQVLRETAKLCRALKRNGYHPILIPFCKNNVPHIKIISKTTNTHVFENWTNIQEVLNFIASCHILIGERLHSIIFSATTYTPFISLEYRPKCMDFAETVGFNKYNIRTDKMTAEKVMAMFSNLSNNWTEIHRQLIKNVEIYRKKLREFANLIKKDIESLPDDKWSPKRLANIQSTLYRCKRKISHSRIFQRTHVH